MERAQAAELAPQAEPGPAARPAAPEPPAEPERRALPEEMVARGVPVESPAPTPVRQARSAAQRTVPSSSLSSYSMLRSGSICSGSISMGMTPELSTVIGFPTAI